MGNSYCNCGNVLYNTHIGGKDGEEYFAFTFDKLNKTLEIGFDEKEPLELYNLSDFTFNICSKCKMLYLSTTDDKGLPSHMFEYHLKQEYDI